MFDKILVANRSEIAVRVLRTCRDLGIRSVAVYSDADRDSLHVQLADEAYAIGPSPSSESYLRIDKIIEVATRSGAQAIHPGYGFLAENAAFAKACADARITFIGPTADAVAMMGDKAEARAVAERAGVPVVPGTPPIESTKQAHEGAERLGYPILVKATGGGGGKGMRQVLNPDELDTAIRQARSEAESSFGNPSVYLEKLIEDPRHIEFQILGDAAGFVVHLYERECSVQRRHQKLIEESPSPFLDEALRERMGSAAVTLAKQAGYTNAGTVEFLVDRSRRFYFLEMNARLQVEHPVTELVTGLDLVELQLAVASGDPIPFRQEQIPRRGWAMEFRITAEDPFQDFLPSAGRIEHLQPAEGPGVRNDSGVYAGCRVTPHYDPMIAKLIVAGNDREHCLARARRAIREYRIHGIRTTLPFFDRMLDEERFVSGGVDVGFVDRFWMSEIARRSSPRRAEVQRAALAAAAAASMAAMRTRDVERPRDGASSWKQAGLREQHLDRF
jgi:acetyl-CoA carboxylase biotin carboxylase subunit